MNGAEMITAERQRQVREEGWHAAHDDLEHRDGQLADAAICYVAHALGYGDGAVSANGGPSWPWAQDWWKPAEGDPVRDLSKAGALLAAEIDRLRRAAGADPHVVPRPTWGYAFATGAPELIGLGDDGHWLVGYGHLEQRLFLALAVAHVARSEGVEFAESLVRFPGLDIRHVWAVERHATIDTVGDHPGGVAIGDDYVWWGDVDEHTEGAFPLTILDREG